MPYRIDSFRLAKDILDHRDEWRQFESVLNLLNPTEILDIHNQVVSQRLAAVPPRVPPAGGQTAINIFFERHLLPLHWEGQPKLFAEEDEELENWTMDFLKNRVGVEIAFNNAGSIPWIFSRLNIAGESERVRPEHKIDIGIAVFAADSMKRWAKMDNAVGTFDTARAWIREMKPILPVPLLIVGLEADGWPETTAFRGTQKGRPSRTVAPKS